MSTRSGRRYKKVDEKMAFGGAEGGAASVADLLQLLLEDRRRRDEREIEERERREREAEERERVMQKQMEALGHLVTGLNTEKPKLTKLTEQDDVEAYLTTFERLMTVSGVRRDRWAFTLAPQLTGRAQKAFAAMDGDEAGDYEALKAAILKRYNINEETYRQRLRSIVKQNGESYREMATRVMDLTSKWTQEHPREGVLELVAMEQLLNSMPEDVRVWTRERKPKTCAEAGELADDYTQARKIGKVETARKGDKRLTVQPMTCFSCGRPGHRASECRRNARPEERRTAMPTRGPTNTERFREPRCYECGKLGHVSTRCPSRVLYGGVRQKSDDRASHRGGKTVYRYGTVDGEPVEDILLDTGCTRTLVHQKLVPLEKSKRGEVTIRCAHGDEVSYPVVEVKIEVGCQVFIVMAGVSETLPVSVLLGTDVPQLLCLLKEDPPQMQAELGEALAVTTRAQARRETEESTVREQNEQTSGAQPRPMFKETESDGKETPEKAPEEPIGAEFDQDIFSGGRERGRQTRREKRLQRQNYAETNRTDDTERQLDRLGADELKKLQESDDTLEAVRRAADGQSSTAGDGFFRRDGVIYRNWKPPGQDGETLVVEQLVLPLPCRQTVLQLAHQIPLAGHMGKNKTADRVRQRFYWPTLFRDAEEFCRTCEKCQKCSTRRGPRAPMVPLPTIEEPFYRIAMDIVGPLPRSRTGFKYILVVCDYATRYPEAFPLKSIDAEHVAEALVSLFSRVGVPKEILTDQGSNFTSRLLAELYRLLHVKGVRTSPYHPQTDGLVERFNRTLKAMLKKTVTGEGKDWDKALPYVLFAYREVPQTTTGFSPFELLYGRTVRGPLDILRECWVASEPREESVVSHILSIREKLERAADLVQENSTRAKAQQKAWYDRNAREREFQPDDQVLVLLPTSTSKLLAQWQGPYRVIRRVGRVDYEIDMIGRKKRRRVFHVNMLKKWYAPVATDCFAEVTDEVNDELVPWKEEGDDPHPVINEELDTTQREQLREVLDEFSGTLTSAPGRTTLAEHRLDVGTARPVRMPPYRLPYAHRETVREELREMEESGVIEPSTSEWASPVVLVKKKDNSMRFCVDYRRLNSVARYDAYPMPRVDELLDRLGTAKYITTLDLARGYWQVPMAEDSREITAFSTPFGLYQFRVMPFGLSGAPATFQRLMDRVVRGLEDFSAAYLDDLVIHSQTWEEHLQHLRAIFQRLQEAGLAAKPQKCQFAMKQCVYLGHVVGNGVVRPEQPKLQAVQSFPVPKTKKDVRTFLGLTGYYRRFVENYASIATPLTDLTKKAAPTRVAWTSRCEASFRALQQALCQAPVLRSPDFSRPFTLQTDASERGVGAVLSQTVDGEEHPVAFFSRKLMAREEKYSTIEKECLAIKLACYAFRVYLLGRRFTIQTDHRALEWLDRLKDNNPRLTRWSLALQAFDFDVKYRSGRANGNADALSRAPPVGAPG